MLPDRGNYEALEVIRVTKESLSFCPDENSGVILPHEKTFSAHKDDRLKLMRACRSQLSQVFGLYDDSENKISGYIKRAADSLPAVSFTYRDGTKHRMWNITDQAFFKRFANVMSEKSIFIADGHHRYETARNFRDIMRARHSRSSENRAYEYVMMYLTSMLQLARSLPLEQDSSEHIEYRKHTDDYQTW